MGLRGVHLDDVPKIACILNLEYHQNQLTAVFLGSGLPHGHTMARVSKRFDIRILQLFYIRIWRSFFRFKQSYSLNSAIIYKNSKSALKFLFLCFHYGQEKQRFLIKLYQGYLSTIFRVVLGSYQGATPQMVCLCPKQAKSALRQLFQQVYYDKSTYTFLYINTRTAYLQHISQIYAISVVLFLIQWYYTQNKRKAHLNINLNTFTIRKAHMWP